MCVNSNNNATYFRSYVAEHIPKEIRKFRGIKNIVTAIYWIQAYDSVMCGGHFWIGLIHFMLKGTGFLLMIMRRMIKYY